ncbi:tRNA (uridine-2'-O-)-methyltransferase TRM7 [Uncinocarpus reesii 1704]|uniref:tRNA (Uridine-2'-O-)-methyltransferase TRM7 n=1 Tax=Uncinocarpus reesii (strain UAMH 1704) TaxID=336963 RepID=C4JH07_UNCRE|nr:tRNA (uridine-2'-O-)-methyltransferase TRM7 [Uncinocarpus reesii 1704]EEP76409.1 tRNA (uridine-2'-O-)-methyltransferase TRM7 [Uncinocarpus reesii 1704]
MAPLEGIATLKADITHPSTIPLLLKALDPDLYDETDSENTNTPSPSKPHSHPVDLVLSDGAPDVTGLHDLDIYIQSQLLYAALNLAIGVLRPGGKFVAKIFRGRDVDLIYAQLKTVFERVSVAKPRSSRASSLEAFVVCEGFMPPVDCNGQSRSGFDNPIFGGAKSGVSPTVETTETDNMRWIPPFIACGDLSAWDADASYELPPDHVSLDPVQPPTAPPYKRALELKKAKGGAYGKTKGVVYDV